MSENEATARIKINKQLEKAGWRFFDDENGRANIQLETNVKIMQKELDDFGNDFETTKDGFIDFLMLDDKGFPLLVLEAKSEDKEPLVGKEQARKYAKSQNCRFVILSNGNLHYFWDLKRGNPYVITKFPNPSSIKAYSSSQPDSEKLINEKIDKNYISFTQRPNFMDEASWKNKDERPQFIAGNKLRFLREYQEKAIRAIQKDVDDGKDRFLFEMATGTGKTLTAAAVIKLFLRTGNARRVLFLVDRLELEEQADKAFKLLLKNDYKSVIYKENRDDWRKAEIVVTTVQSLLYYNKYQKLFSPTDFDLVISDEAHRSIGGNARAVFEYFIGYKLGLTATPKDYLKKFDKEKEHKNRKDPREYERRMLLDTYRTFGCADSQPTFRYSLLDGVKDGFLINPIVVDARTEITTQLLSEKGIVIEVTDENGDIREQTYKQRQFEKSFYSEVTNKVFCKTFLENALLDPVSQEIGKTIVFAVSQLHASKLTQILNEMADQMFPGKYQSDFAVQVTSEIPDAQQMTINFTNNKLLGSANFLAVYKTTKARVCVTVGMMTTGYDCPDLLNLCLLRPIFSPTDFIQIKGRGTRKYNFLELLFDEDHKALVKNPEKAHYKIFDFFANCEYFEEKFDYDEILKLTKSATPNTGGVEEPPPPLYGEHENFDPDHIVTMEVQTIGLEGMRIDRMFFEKFEDKVKEDTTVKTHVANDDWERVMDYVNSTIMNKPHEYYTLNKLRKAAGVDRRLGLREILEKVFGRIERFKSKDELLNEEFDKFISDYKPEDSSAIVPMKQFFKAYITDNHLRGIVEDSQRMVELNTNPSFTMSDFKAMPQVWRKAIPEYIKDYVPLNQFMS